MESKLFLQGKTISLRPLSERDVEGSYLNWLNDPEIVKFNSHGRFPSTVEKLRSYIKQTSDSKDILVLAVVDQLTERHIGNISLQNINWIDRNAEIAFLLGERDFLGKGVMLEAGRLLLKHGFLSLNLHRIYCGTSSENIGMQKLAHKLGLIQEGIRKESFFKNGKYVDILEYGLLVNDWSKIVNSNK